MRVIGLDIGGANLKAADADGAAVSVPFPVWKSPEQLSAGLYSLLTRFDRPDCLAVTMTAELADCFETKAAGVGCVLDQLAAAAPDLPVLVWLTSGEFVPAGIAREFPILAAAANWHALATWAGRMVPDAPGLLIDVGSTTTDIIPLLDGLPVPDGRTDPERLQSGELVYTGVRRTPVCAALRDLPWREARCPVAAELFATTLDAYLLLGEIAEDPDDCETANGRPATRAAALDRLARCLCCDRTEFDTADALRAAEEIRAAQQTQILAAVEQVLGRQPEPPQRVLISGSGSFLAETVIEACALLRSVERVRLDQSLCPAVAEAACAFAVVRLAQERAAAEFRSPGE